MPTPCSQAFSSWDRRCFDRLSPQSDSCRFTQLSSRKLQLPSICELQNNFLRVDLFTLFFFNFSLYFWCICLSSRSAVFDSWRSAPLVWTNGSGLETADSSLISEKKRDCLCSKQMFFMADYKVCKRLRRRLGFFLHLQTFLLPLTITCV